MSCELLILKIMMSREKIPEPRNTHEKKKSWTHETPTIKNLGLKKYKRDKISDPRNTRQKEFWTHRILTRKSLGSSKYPQEKNLGHAKYQLRKISDLRRHNCARPTMARDPQNLAH